MSMLCTSSIIQGCLIKALNSETDKWRNNHINTFYRFIDKVKTTFLYRLESVNNDWPILFYILTFYILHLTYFYAYHRNLLLKNSEINNKICKKILHEIQIMKYLNAMIYVKANKT